MEGAELQVFRSTTLGPGASPGRKCGVDTHGERVKREPITGVWAPRSAEPPGQASPPELLKVKTF